MSKEELDTDLRNREVARSALAEAQATERKAKLAYEAKAPNGENVTVAQLKAESAKAKYDLDQCTIVAPADGRVVNLQLQEGSYMSVATPMLDFVPDSDKYVVASVQENYLRFVKPGDPAEVVLSYYPGRTLKGRVDKVLKLTGEGQVSSAGTSLPDVAKVIQTGGRFAVVVRLDDSNGPLDLPVGAGGSAAVYTDQMTVTHVIRRVMLRMETWMHYII
ncbi:MAG TPA: efflux RND transporter periplasmic adaptor subunit [Gemmataceae bacterium]|nr:efflux RND transporter periplasmic adaptor subunit [Gemmataceae bacterium]